ncbi:MAG: 16S rRNA (guanine1516-N2)-methyltransferase [Alphaproteobacteria bacterium]|jgi:16S rRNA (guanine1516-N2)-methyltransferase
MNTQMRKKSKHVSLLADIAPLKSGESLASSEPLIENAAILVEDNGSLYANEQAKLLSKKLGLQVHTIPTNKQKQKFTQAQWQLVYTAQGLVLRLSSEPSWSDIMVDFAAANLHYRQQHGGGRNEAIAKAIGIKGKQSVNVVDCTAGMGTDSFIMASVGANVTMIERSPIISALLDNALQRAKLAIESGDNLECLAVCERMKLLQQDAISFLQSNTAEKTQTDVIYLDPMFPHKKKSALVKKEMRAFQLLLGPDQDSEHLLTAAINFAPKRIVIKRPASAPNLENQQALQPNMAISSKKHRFDVYFLRQ